MTDSCAQVLIDGDTAWVRVCGRATFVFGQPMREFVARAGRLGVKRFRVDVTDCRSMDSTFIGILTLAAMESATAGGDVEVVNADERVTSQFCDLGLRELFRFTRGQGHGADLACGAEDLPPADPRAPGVHRAMVEAHETLVRAHSDNRGRFKDLLEFLRTTG